MNTREIAAEYLLRQWAEIIRERNASGMTVKEFSKAAGFHQNVYYYWQRKLREAACQELAAPDNGSRQALVPQGWAVCQPAEANTKANGLTVEISGCQVRVEEDTDPELLARVCRVLKALC